MERKDNILIDAQNNIEGVRMSHMRRDSLLVATQSYLNAGVYTFALIAAKEGSPPLGTRSCWWSLVSFDGKLSDLYYSREHSILAFGRCTIDSEYTRILALVECVTPIDVLQICGELDLKSSKLPIIFDRLETWFRK